MQNPPLSPETQAKIDALAQKISIAHHLDEEIQAELRAHIEDKLTAYLTGELRLSEADAFLLAQTHFGDPETLCALLRTAHQQCAPITRSLVGRLTTLTLATLIICPTIGLFAEIAGNRLIVFPAALKAYRQNAPLDDWSLQLSGLIPPVLQFLVLACALLLWRRRKTARTVRPQARRLLAPWVVAFFALSVPVIMHFAREPIAGALVPPAGIPSGASVAGSENPFSTFHQMIAIVTTALYQSIFFLWVWWIGPTRAKITPLLATAGAFIIAECLIAVPRALDFAFFRDLPRHMDRFPRHARLANHYITLLSHILPYLAGGIFLCLLYRYLQQYFHRRKMLAV